MRDFLDDHGESLIGTACCFLAIALLAGVALAYAHTDNALCKSDLRGQRSATYCASLAWWIDGESPSATVLRFRASSAATVPVPRFKPTQS